MITGAQVRAAKALLSWSGGMLSASAGVALSSIRKVEAVDGVPENVSVKTLISIKKALEDAGVEFIGTPEDGPGVRLYKV